MPVTNPGKTIDAAALACTGTARMTLSFDAAPALGTEPADIVLIVDRSGSMGGAPLAAAQQAARDMIRTVALASGNAAGDAIENNSRMALVSFSTEAAVDLPLGTDAAALADGVSALTAGGRTNHAAAFQKAFELLQPSTLPRRIVVMFTDGPSNIGNADPVAETIKQAGMELFCIGLGADPTPLNRWASDPDAVHVALAAAPAQLQDAFAAIAAEVVLAGARDMVLRDILNPDFRIVSVDPPTHGAARAVDGQTLEWTAGAVGAAGAETAALTFTVQHIGTGGGVKTVNARTDYRDQAGSKLEFVSPEVTVTCGGSIVYPEPCPMPVTVLAAPCEDLVAVQAGDAVLTGLGRIVRVDVTLKNICPGKQVAAAIILTELDADGVEHPRGTKTILVPPQDGTECVDVLLKCINFVVPETLSAAGGADALCKPRGFRTRVIANYTDSDFTCCDPQTVIL